MKLKERVEHYFLIIVTLSTLVFFVSLLICFIGTVLNEHFGGGYRNNPFSFENLLIVIAPSFIIMAGGIALGIAYDGDKKLKKKKLKKKKEPRSEMHDMIRAVNPGARYEDEIPKGIGKFGLVKTNPIPVYGIDNVPNYMKQLRYKHTSQKGIVLYYPIQYKRTNDSDNSEEGTPISDSSDTVASTSADNIGDYIDVYNIYSFDGKRKLAKFYLHSYHWKTSVKVPEGFVNVSTVPAKQDGNKILEVIQKA